MKQNSLDTSSAWWQQARAALARVFGTVHVRQLEMNAPQLENAGRISEATVWPAPGGGAHENDWPPVAGVRAWQPLAAQGGGGGLDAAAVPCFVGGSAVPRLGDEGVQAAQVHVPVPPVHQENVEAGMGGTGTSLPLPVLLSGGQPCALPVALPVPPVRAVLVALGGSSRGEAKRDGRSGVPAFRAPRTGARLAWLTRVPLVRRRATLPAGADMTVAFAAEHQALASACGATPEEVKLLAAFPHVPLALVQQMAVTPDGDALRLWLRPEPLASGAGWTTAKVTIVLGRRRATGETIRAVLPETRPEGKKR